MRNLSKIEIATERTVEMKYTVDFTEEGLLKSIHVEGPGIEKRFYARNPRQHELKLTVMLFEEIVADICQRNLEKAVELEEKMRSDTEFYLVLQKCLIKTGRKDMF